MQLSKNFETYLNATHLCGLDPFSSMVAIEQGAANTQGWS
jgi:hypothetical protein